MAAGITQPGGAGTTIFVYDDASSGTGLGYTFAEISTAFPTDFIDNGTNRKSYRSKVTVQIGDGTTGAATTTIKDTDAVVIFDSGKTLTSRATQTTSWYLRLGTKVGSGNTASGVSGCDITLGAAPAAWPRQAFVCGGLLRQTSGAFQQPSTDGVSEYIGCLIQSSSTGTAPISLGSSGNAFSNLYDIGISHTTSAQVLNNFGSGTASRITVACASPTTFLLTAGINVSVKDMVLIGSPTQSDLRWNSSAATGWVFVSPTWTGNAPKFSCNMGGPSLANATLEYWPFDAKLVDELGVGVSGIPVKLTDAFGNVLVDTTTGSNGQVTYGSGILENRVEVMDHYAIGTTYTQRHRSPFTKEYNTGPSANPNYAPQTSLFYWPGYETVTLTSGSFEPVTDIATLSAPVAPAAPPVPITIAELPLPAESSEYILTPVGG